MTPTRICFFPRLRIGGAPRRAARAARALVFVTLAVFGCGRGDAEKGSRPPMGAAPVVVCEALRRDVPIGLKAIGSVEAIQTVEVRARVGGEISRVAFKRGRDVRRGELLFVIDPRPYEAELRQVEADSARNAARAASAEATALRYADLVEKGYVTRQEYDEAVANAEALRAEVRANQAEIERARLDLGFCSIRSPIDGRAGDLLIHPGNLVQANGEDPLVVIHQLAPVYVSFSVPERRLAEIKKQASAGTLRVEASLPEDSSSTWEGSLTFIDNAVDETTGTILLKATFPNEDRVLWPGQFVDVELTLATRRGALVVPAEAVQSGQQGGYVFVIGPDTTADLRTVRTGPRANGEIVIEEGVEPGEKVVVEGQLRLFPGAKAAVKRTEAPPGATAR